MTGMINFPARIQACLQAEGSLKLLNTYRGIPIQYPGEIVGISDHSLAVKVHKHQAVCLALQQYTYLKCGQSLLFFAEVIKGEIERQHFTLAAFQEADESIGNRETIRVHPKSPLPVILTNFRAEKSIASELIDLSINGLGVYGLSVTLTDIQAFAENTQINARLILPDGLSGEAASQEIDIRGTIINRFPDQTQKRFRLGVRLAPDFEQQAVISTYISRRQTEIISEIRRLYQSLVNMSA